MSGICGIWDGLGQGVNPSDLEQMMEQLAHRGPDGQRLWIEGGVGLGHLMLWTTPESQHEILPCQRGDLVLTADARLDNREILAEQLEISPAQLSGLPDSQLILRAYQRWGTACPDYLLGDFSFVIWDSLRHKLFCARDHLGVKPFYYYRSGAYFAFASQIRALLALPQVPRRVNYPHIQALYSNQLDRHQTFYQQIYRLPPASILMISNTGFEITSYWSLDPERELHLGSDEEYAEAFRDLFFQSVNCRLRSAYAIGSHLSGGLDSSSITCVARQILRQQQRQPLHIFSHLFEQVRAADERSFIMEVVQQGDLQPHGLQPERMGPMVLLEHYLSYEDEGYIDPNHYLIWSISQVAQDQGVRVICDGYDGDTVVGHGSTYLVELFHQEAWSQLQKQIRGTQAEGGLDPEQILLRAGVFSYLQHLFRQGQWKEVLRKVKWIESNYQLSIKYLGWQYGLKPLIPRPIVALSKQLRGLPLPDPQIHPTVRQGHFFRADFATRTGLTDIFAADRKLAQPPSPSVRQAQYHVLTLGLISFSLEVIDRTAANHQLEARHPFLDKRLVEFCLSLPPDQKSNHGWDRIILRRAMQEILPPKVQWRRRKANMSPGFAYGLLQINRQALYDLLYDPSHSFHACVDIPRLQNLYQKAIREHQINSLDCTDAIALWRTITLALWLATVESI